MAIVSFRISDDDFRKLKRFSNGQSVSSYVRQLVEEKLNEEQKQTVEFIALLEEIRGLIKELIEESEKVDERDKKVQVEVPKEITEQVEKIQKDSRVTRNLVALLAYFSPTVSKSFKEMYPEFFDSIKEVIR